MNPSSPQESVAGQSGSAATTPADSPTVAKVIVAVHGIGDQTRNATIQSVVARFCSHHGYPAIVPLGAFQQTLRDNNPAFVLQGPPPNPGLVGVIGFAEVYWAVIPRRIVSHGYTLQETKEWAKSIVARVGVLARSRAINSPVPGFDHKQVREVLEDLITAISVIEALTFLARKAEIIDFSLKKLLDDYLGDIQIMTEFAPQREQIVAEFREIMDAVHRIHPQAEIHIVAHSEGTVVSWLGLLQAMTEDTAPPWLPRVRGFMTIGSPIDKHLILWPELFREFTGPQWRSPAPQNRIKWRNYVDYGDPVGFELDTARDWMACRHYDENFDFTPADDFAFGRYYLPGKAHNDYWEDEEVFGHFIDGVVKSPPTAHRHGPKDKWGAQFCSYVVAYAIPLALVYAGVYLLYKMVGKYLEPASAPAHMAKNVALLGGLVAGTIVLWRMFVLTRSVKWRLIGVGVATATTLLFGIFLEGTGEMRWFIPFAGHGAGGQTGWLLLPAIGLAVAAMLQIVGGDHSQPGTRRARTERRSLSVVKLVVMSVGVLLLLNAASDWIMRGANRPLWPLMSAIPASVYLWWLAIMFFDLVFVWHRYIRHAVALEFMRRALWQENASPKSSEVKQ